MDGWSHSLFLKPEGHRSLERIKVLASEHEQRVRSLVGAKRRQKLINLLKDFG
jgi:hypothetical protein